MTTERERQERILIGICMYWLGGQVPIGYAMELIDQYLNGFKTIDDIRNELIEYHKSNDHYPRITPLLSLPPAPKH